MIPRRNTCFFFGLLFIVLAVSVPIVFGNGTLPTAKNIEFVNADLRDVFRSLAATGKFNVIMEPQVHGNVTLALRYGVTIKDAVSVIAKTYGYNCRWLADSATVLVGSSKFIQANFDSRTSKTYLLKYVDPKEIAASLEVVIPKSRIKVDLPSHQIVVLANEIEINNITEIIEKLDREFQPINFEVQLAEVPAGIWNKLGITNNYQPPHMGVYVLKDAQKKVIAEMVLKVITKSDFSGLDNHLLRIFLGDKASFITTKKRKGDVNYQVEYVNAGNSLSMFPQINTEHQLTLMTKATVSTIANRSQSSAKWVPWVVTRDFESTLRLEIGQTFILSGLLQRNEYQMMKKSPYRFPELDKLFASQKSAESKEKKFSGELIVLITPRIAEKIGLYPTSDPGNPVLSISSEQAKDGSGENGNIPSDIQTTTSENKLSIYEDKPTVKIELDNAKIDPGEIKEGHEAGDKKVSNSKFVEIHYHVKKGDTLTNIVKKFATTMKLVMAKNNLNKASAINENLFLLIPVPAERIYILKPKETLWRIAKRYGTALEVLKDLNGISDETKVYAGETIVLPCIRTRIVNPQF